MKRFEVLMPAEKGLAAWLNRRKDRYWRAESIDGDTSHLWIEANRLHGREAFPCGYRSTTELCVYVEGEELGNARLEELFACLNADVLNSGYHVTELDRKEFKKELRSMENEILQSLGYQGPLTESDVEGKDDA